MGECSVCVTASLYPPWSLAGSTSAEACVDPASACTYDATTVVERERGAQPWMAHFD
eukprot:COSAG06_NODE_59133_length_275_cov_0.585227_1_plen_56_part_01